MLTLKNGLSLLFVVCLLAVMVLVPTPSYAATFVIVNLDGAGEGFNDNTAFTPVGGNPAVTLGAARLFAFQYAANLWGACLQSAVTVEVRAQMNDQSCGATSAVLGSAAAWLISRDFAGAPFPSTWYHHATANAILGFDEAPGAGNEDVTATFNKKIDTGPNCLNCCVWYYGVDANPPGNDIDFVTVVTHEIAHGIGFSTFVSLGTGAKFGGFDDAYMRNLEHHGAVPADYPSMSNAQRVAASTSDPNLHWLGSAVHAGGNQILTGGISNGHVRMHGPNPQQGGSSVSHFSTALTPSETMEPSYTGPAHALSLGVNEMADVGWVLTKGPTAVPTSNRLDGFKLSQNYPNPFSPSTLVHFELPQTQFVELNVYDVKGKLIRTLINSHRPPGPQGELWDGVDNDGRRAASGVYFYKLTAGDFVQTKRMVLLR